MRCTSRWLHRRKREFVQFSQKLRFQNVISDVGCPGGKCGFSEEGGRDRVEKARRREVNEAVTGSADGDAEEGEGPDIYIDDAVEEEEKAEGSQPASP